MTIEKRLASLLGPEPEGISERVALGTGLADGYDYYETPIGTVVVTFNPTGVSSVDMTDGFERRFEARFGRALIRAEAPSAWARRIPEALERGRPERLPVDYRSVTPFQRRVLETTATIPKGEVRPYGWVAKEIESPKAVRAVGSAVAKNPVPLIVPCHRVVRTDGRIGNYSLGGPGNKVELLESEGAAPATLEELAARRVRVQGNDSTGVFCHPTCGRIRRSKPSNVVDFRTATEATAAGFRPCKVCRPVG